MDVQCAPLKFVYHRIGHFYTHRIRIIISFPCKLESDIRQKSFHSYSIISAIYSTRSESGQSVRLDPEF